MAVIKAMIVTHCKVLFCIILGRDLALHVKKKKKKKGGS